MAEYPSFGLNASGYHLVNVALHVLNALLLFEVLRRTTRSKAEPAGAIGPSAFVALLFAVHPTHVESVAWVAERKDVLCALFWLLAMLAYGAYARRPSVGRYLLVVLPFALGLMAKQMLVTLPCVLLLMDYWPLRRLGPASSRPAWPRVVLEKVPLVLLSAVAAGIAFFVQIRGEEVGTFGGVPLGLRLGNALVSYGRYIQKTLWPARLAVYYPHPGHGLPLWQPVAAAVALVAVTAVIVLALRRRRYLTIGWLWYLGTLVPVIGIIQIGSQAMADRYTYLPSVGLYIMAAWGLRDLASAWRVPRAAVLGAAAALVVGLSAATFVQAGYWRDSTTLFNRALAVTSNNSFVHYNLGLTRYDEGDRAGAAEHFREALRITPDFDRAHVNLAQVLAELGRNEDAIRCFRDRLRVAPEDAHTHNGLAIALAKQGRLEEAVEHLAATLRFDPHYPGAEFTLGNLLATLGEVEASLLHFERALHDEPADVHPMAHLNLGVQLAKLGKPDKAEAHFREAVALDPDFADAYVNLGVLHAQQGEREQAAALYRKALEIDPRHAAARRQLERLQAEKATTKLW